MLLKTIHILFWFAKVSPEAPFKPYCNSIAIPIQYEFFEKDSGVVMHEFFCAGGICQAVIWFAG